MHGGPSSRWFRALAGAALVVAASTGHASNCESIRAGIDAKIRAAGVTAYTLATLPADAPTTAKVVGRCERGTKKIVYVQAPGAASRPAPAEPGILTECRDGSVSVGGDCPR